jgi:hypothetical protein
MTQNIVTLANQIYRAETNFNFHREMSDGAFAEYMRAKQEGDDEIAEMALKSSRSHRAKADEAETELLSLLNEISKIAVDAYARIISCNQD